MTRLKLTRALVHLHQNTQLVPLVLTKETLLFCRTMTQLSLLMSKKETKYFLKLGRQIKRSLLRTTNDSTQFFRTKTKKLKNCNWQFRNATKILKWTISEWENFWILLRALWPLSNSNKLRISASRTMSNSHRMSFVLETCSQNLKDVLVRDNQSRWTLFLQVNSQRKRISKWYKNKNLKLWQVES
jgi:hypothetical protein